MARINLITANMVARLCDDISAQYGLDHDLLQCAAFYERDGFCIKYNDKQLTVVSPFDSMDDANQNICQHLDAIMLEHLTQEVVDKLVELPLAHKINALFGDDKHWLQHNLLESLAIADCNNQLSAWAYLNDYPRLIKRVINYKPVTANGKPLGDAYVQWMYK